MQSANHLRFLQTVLGFFRHTEHMYYFNNYYTHVHVVAQQITAGDPTQSLLQCSSGSEEAEEEAIFFNNRVPLW